MSSRPISMVELERRRLTTAASLSKDLEAITAWGLKNMVEFNASKAQYCTLSNKRCPSEHSVLTNNQALQRSHSFKLLGECRLNALFSLWRMQWTSLPQRHASYPDDIDEESEHIAEIMEAVELTVPDEEDDVRTKSKLDANHQERKKWSRKGR
nr:unnamed protein product [Callosobruchus chinensis]